MFIVFLLFLVFFLKVLVGVVGINLLIDIDLIFEFIRDGVMMGSSEDIELIVDEIDNNN